MSGVPYSFFLDRYADSYVNIMSAFVNFVKTGDESLEPALGIDGKVTIFIGESCSWWWGVPLSVCLWCLTNTLVLGEFNLLVFCVHFGSPSLLVGCEGSIGTRETEERRGREALFW